MESGARFYAPISSSWVKGCGGSMLVKISALCCTSLIFTCSDINGFIHPVMVHHSNHYTQDTHLNIPRYWVVKNPKSGYMDYDGWLKSVAHFASTSFSSPLNTQVLFYDGQDIHFDDMSFNIINSHNIQSFVLKAGDSVQ